MLVHQTRQLPAGPRNCFIDQVHNSFSIQGIIDTVLESQLKTETYEPKASKQTALTLAQIIKDRVKDLGYERYKLICMVSIGQLNEQGFQMGSRCCWDAKWDTFASSSFKNKSLFAIAIVWGVYYE